MCLHDNITESDRVRDDRARANHTQERPQPGERAGQGQTSREHSGSGGLAGKGVVGKRQGLAGRGVVGKSAVAGRAPDTGTGKSNKRQRVLFWQLQQEYKKQRRAEMEDEGRCAEIGEGLLAERLEQMHCILKT